jgi:hypothetical protein
MSAEAENLLGEEGLRATQFANFENSRLIGPEVGIEEFRKNLIGISLEFHENFKETACISDVYCIQ